MSKVILSPKFIRILDIFLRPCQNIGFSMAFRDLPTKAPQNLSISGFSQSCSEASGDGMRLGSFKALKEAAASS